MANPPPQKKQHLGLTGGHNEGDWHFGQDGSGKDVLGVADVVITAVRGKHIGKIEAPVLALGDTFTLFYVLQVCR